ncbi:MAG TPA: FG-GAP-like repeat-containing protein [Archangium sp.]|uniref:FG-GAP-like repeat-containing protein n=1 Tax=Archangium sp. TaxID=1872627 RepID=UPI002EDB29ED
MRETHSPSRTYRRWPLLVLLSSLACSPTEQSDDDPRHLGDGESLGQTRGEVVYGTDNRQDVYAHPDATLRARAQQSTVAVMMLTALDTTDPNNVTFNAPTLGRRFSLCPTERFREDPTAAFCSGTLIDDDVVLTAGHCISSSADCADMRFVFNYYQTAAGTLQPVTTADVFTCTSIVSRKQGSVDYSLVRLDRPATPRFTPAPVKTGNTALASGQNVAVIGCGSGIPYKVDSGGSVRDPRAGTLDYFVATTDTFGGNSGSGVYETSGYTVAGILVRGDTDYVNTGTCNVVNTCPETGCRGEDITYVYSAIGGFCRSTNNASARLCGNKSADFNKDGSLDVLWQNRTADKSAIWFMKDGAQLSQVELQGTSDVNWQPVATGDFDSDGNLDVLRHHRTRGQLALWLLRDGSRVSEVVLQGYPDVNWQPVTAGDFDGDGELDVLWHHHTQGQLAFWFLRAGTLLSSVVLQGFNDVNWRPVTAADFNGDGDLDVLWHHRTNGKVALWFMRAGTRLSDVVIRGYSDVNWQPVTAADFNRDGSLDILWHHRTQGQLALWFMHEGTVLSTGVLQGLPDVNWRPISVGDLNRDGDQDILWHHRTQGRLALWFMRGGTRLSEVVLQGFADTNWYVVR